MPKTKALPDRNAFLRRLRQARTRLFAMSVLSLVAASIILLATNAHEIGAFAFHSLILLLLSNALLAQLQYRRVIRPVAKLLTQLQALSEKLEGKDLPSDFFLEEKDDAVFAELAAGVTTVLTRLGERLRFAERHVELKQAALAAVPFTLFTVSPKGKVYSVIQDVYNLMSVLQLTNGRDLPKDVWTDENVAIFQTAIDKAFDGTLFAWFDLHFKVDAESVPRHLRGTVSRLDEMSALVVLGDIPAIDHLVECATNKGHEAEFERHQHALRRFAASIAHDAKNVFVVLNNLLEVNRQSSDPAVRNQIPMSEDAIRRGTELMHELMTFSGQTHYAFACIHANEMLRGCICSPTLKGLCPPNVEIFVNIPKDLPYVDADVDQLWKVPFNLVKNSVEAMRGTNGRIGFKAETYVMTESRVKDYHHAANMRLGEGVLITLSDDGPGIPPAMLDHLFDPYFTSKGEGRGIGLATVLSIIIAHGGAIRVLSKFGRGTTFVTWLPTSRNSPEEIAMINEVAPNGEILLVDDDKAILRTTAFVLQTLKVAAHPASDAESAMRKLRSVGQRLRAVLVDAHLCGTPSTDLVRQIRSEWPNLPIIVTSGDGEDAVRALFKGVPFDLFLEKPYPIAELAKALHVSVAEGSGEAKSTMLV